MDDFIYQDDETQINTLHSACTLDSPIRDRVVILLVRDGANLNHPGKIDNIANFTALHFATIRNYDRTIELLLNLGANVDLRDSTDFSPYCYAVQMKSQTAELLGCFKEDFAATFKIVDLFRKAIQNNGTVDKNQKISPPVNSTNNFIAQNSNDKPAAKCNPNNGDKSHYIIPKVKQAVADGAKIQNFIRGNDVVPYSNGISKMSPKKLSKNSPNQLLRKSPKSSPKRYAGRFEPITATVLKIIDHTVAGKPPGFIVELEGSKDIHKVSIEDLYQHEPHKLRRYLKRIKQTGGQRWRRVKEGFGEDQVDHVLKTRKTISP